MAFSRGQGYAVCRIDRVQSEEKVEAGEWFYTSGDDRVFPKGMPAGQVKIVRPGPPFQEIFLEPSGLQNGVEEVLIVLEGVHQQIPDLPVCQRRDPPDAAADPAAVPTPPAPAPAPRLLTPRLRPEPTPTACATATS